MQVSDMKKPLKFCKETLGLPLKTNQGIRLNSLTVEQ